MITQTEIINFALLAIGDKPIMDPEDESTDRGRICRAFYPMVRNAVLMEYPWRCARVRASLPRLSESPLFGYLYQYQLPSEPYCLWVPKILNEDFDYEIEGRYLLTNEPSCQITYVSIVPESLMDALLVDCIATRLASQIAPGLSNKMGMAEMLWKLYLMKIDQAKASDSMQLGGTSQETSILTSVR